MNYVIVDMEWNQPLSHRSAPFRRVGHRLMFELIQIGAVKLDDKRRMVGSFSRNITPEQYLKLHPRIRRITGITQEDLADAPKFLPALAQFLNWCGDDCVLLTWGSDDISVLQQNLDFFKAPQQMPPFYDLQKLYSSLQEGTQHKNGLSAAMAQYAIAATPDHPFHNAVDDAYYTALVFQQMPEAEAVLKFPEKPRVLGIQKRETESELAVTVRSERAFFQGAHSRAAACPVCGKKARIGEGYVPVRGIHTALADCPTHGLLFSEVTFERDEDKRLVARRKTWVSDEQNPAYVQTKHLQWAQKVARLHPREESA